MNDIVQYLTKLRLRTAGDKCEKVKQREVRLSTSYMYVPNYTLYENMYVPVHSASAPTLCLLFYKVNISLMQMYVQAYDRQCVLCHAMCSALSTRVASSHDSSHSGELSTCRHQKLPTLFRSGTCTMYYYTEPRI